MGIFGTSKMKLFVGSDKVKKAYLGTEKIYSAGNIVTYHVDTGVSYQEEVESGRSCLMSFPRKDGWAFVGWREDTTASDDVLSSKIMGDEPMTLYAVFKQDIYLYYRNGNNFYGSVLQDIYETRYYNNGNFINPKFTIEQNKITNWESRGWTTDTKADAEVEYEVIHDMELPLNITRITLNALYQRTITLSYYGNGATSGSMDSQTGIRYYNCYNENFKDPTFKLASNGYSRTGHNFNGWDLGAVGATITLSASKTAYAQWTAINYI